MFIDVQTRPASLATPVTEAVLPPPPDDVPMVVVDGEEFWRWPRGGGLVALTASVSPHVYVATGARIRGRAVVDGGVRLFHQSVIEDQAIVLGPSTLRGTSSIGGEAYVRGNVQLHGDSRIAGTTHVVGIITLGTLVQIAAGEIRGHFTLC